MNIIKFRISDSKHAYLKRYAKVRFEARAKNENRKKGLDVLDGLDSLLKYMSSNIQKIRYIME